MTDFDNLETIQGQSYLGKCYDIVTLDPFNMANTAKSENAIDVDAAHVKPDRDGKYKIPVGSEHTAIFSTDYESSTRVISSSYDLQTELKQTIEVNTGVEGIFEFSGSHSLNELVQQSESRKKVFSYARVVVRNHKLRLIFDEPKEPLALGYTFQQAVKALPIDALADNIAYEKFIARFGTHFATEIVLGGMASQQVSANSRKVLSKKETEDKFIVKAKLEVELITAGASAEDARKRAETIDKEEGFERSTLKLAGGTAAADGKIDSSWYSSLKDQPVPVGGEFKRLTELFIPHYFPDDPNIETKREWMDVFITQYIGFNGKNGLESRPLRYGETIPLYSGYSSLKNLSLVVNETKQCYLPKPDEATNFDYPQVLVRLENYDDPNSREHIFSGDKVFIRVLNNEIDSYLGVPETGFNTKTPLCAWEILRAGDKIIQSERLGQFIKAGDVVGFIYKPNSDPRSYRFLVVDYAASRSLIANYIFYDSDTTDRPLGEIQGHTLR